MFYITLLGYRDPLQAFGCWNAGHHERWLEAVGILEVCQAAVAHVNDELGRGEAQGLAKKVEEL